MNTTKPQLVVKLGTAVLCGNKEGEEAILDQTVFDSVATQVMRLQQEGWAITIVSSGGIQAGKEKFRVICPHAKIEKCALAGIGARHLLSKWGEAFGKYGVEIAQIWVGYEILSPLLHKQHKHEKANIALNISEYHQHGVIAIVNGNDVVSRREVDIMEKGGGENDRIARKLAFLINAQAVLFLTSVGGVYETNPQRNPNARMYREIDHQVICEILKSEPEGSLKGSGGMCAKLSEAWTCFEHGKRVAIAGMSDSVIIKFAHKRPVGTSIGTTAVFA